MIPCLISYASSREILRPKAISLSISCVPNDNDPTANGIYFSNTDRLDTEDPICNTATPDSFCLFSKSNSASKSGEAKISNI